MTIQQRLRELADEAPPARVPPGLFDRARRRRRLRRSAVAAVLVALTAGTVAFPPGPFPPTAPTATPGLPDRLVAPPWWTDTVRHSPNGPASVVFIGYGPQADHEDYKLQFWREGYTIEPSVAVGLDRDTYRIVRGAYVVGVMLSPDGRYLVWERDGDAEVLDLTTGMTRSLAGTGGGLPYGWSADGRWLLLTDNGTAQVMSWPSGRMDWQVRFDTVTRDPYRLALSPDASMLAVTTVQGLRVYRRDGTLLWERATSAGLVAGGAAWINERRLAVLERGVPVCPACPQVQTPYPGTWSLAFVDALTGRPATDAPRYPPLTSALDVRVVAWRGDTAYAIVFYNRPDAALYDPRAVTLVKLVPGAVGAQTVLTAPADAWDMNVATDYVDTVRPAGSPLTGVNVREVAARWLCLVPVLFLLAFLGFAVWLSRRGRPTRPTPSSQIHA